MRFERISVDHRVMGGVPCIIGTHLPVATIVSLVAEGRTPTDIVANYPQLVVDGVRAAFAPHLLRRNHYPDDQENCADDGPHLRHRQTRSSGGRRRRS